ncbi:hypothetical protein HPB48_018246 [Haemaphysalis longicornis]|uniref:DDE-1 domain-containing protein n=1 Tax=Haemaphysalis longicornis TaxID=44386 RepID=A0A9J6FDD3_HAELO|nr:hypothetical protein HPB48_018246 [Haemaphysalis longicornis]
MPLQWPLPPNATARLQPFDTGIIQNFKLNYRRPVIGSLLILICQEMNLKIYLWMAVQMIKGGWTDVTRETRQKCFKKAGFASPWVSPASVEDVVNHDAREDARQAWKEAVEAGLVSDADNLIDFFDADIAVWVT